MTENNYEQFLAYFYRDVLTHYKSKPDVYRIYEEDYGGFIYNNGSSSWFQIRYAFRKQVNGNIAVAAWIPDLIKLSETEKNIWQGFKLENPSFISVDESFDDWIGTYMSPGGRFPKVSIRPIAKIYIEIGLINAITLSCCSSKFFKKDENPHLQYPDAENIKSYRYSILELHNLVNDEMNQETMETISSHIQITLTDSSKKLNSLKKLLPQNKIKLIHTPLRDCSNKRAKIHGISSKETESFDAFNSFHNDLNDIGDALSELKIWLEQIYSVNADSCLRRVEMENYLPELEEQSYLKDILENLKEAEGKTIEKIEFGKQKSNPNCHESEGANIHFSDGTSLFIRIGSNSQDIADIYDELKPNDFHTNLFFNWAPSIQKK